jgi:hypothetical protein
MQWFVPLVPLSGCADDARPENARGSGSLANDDERPCAAHPARQCLRAHVEGEHREHAQRYASVHVLLEHDPGQHGGQHALRIGEQERLRRGDDRKPRHQQDRRCDAARHDGACQPRPFTPGQGHRRYALDATHHPQTHSGTQVQQRGQQGRRDASVSMRKELVDIGVWVPSEKSPSSRPLACVSIILSASRTYSVWVPIDLRESSLAEGAANSSLSMAKTLARHQPCAWASDLPS